MHFIVCSYLAQFSQNWVKYLGFWGKKQPNIPQWDWYDDNWPQCSPLNGAEYLQGKHVVLYIKKWRGGVQFVVTLLKKWGKNIWKMREMRPAAAGPLGWVDFTTRKCQRCRQRNPTPRGKTLNQTQSNCSDKFPPKYLPEMLPNLLPHYSSFPQISPSFHILRFKRALQLRPSHKGCGKENISIFKTNAIVFIT